jgi:hypothetical protein
MEIRDYNIGDESKILDLFRIVYNQKLPLENWLWRFRDNPAGKHFIKLMWDDDKLVGHYAVSPLKMIVESQEFFTALSLTTMTHPEYQGRGIFSELSLALYHELEQKYNCKAIWGFPNNNSHYAFVKKLDWKNLVVQHTLALNVFDLKPRGIEFSFEEIKNFKDSHHDYISQKQAESSKVHVSYTSEYLNWRFINKPNSDYKCYEFKSEYDRSLIIVKLYRNLSPVRYVLNIICCFSDNYAGIHDYLKFIINDLGKDFEKVTIWKNLSDPDHLSLERQGFTPELPQTYIASRIHESMPDSFSDFRNWNISMSDSDVF